MSVSLCVLRIEIDEELAEMGDNSAEVEHAKEQKKKDRGSRDSKIITVETYASVLMGPNSVSGILPTSSRRSPREGSTSEDENTISFFCGNPLVEVTKGVLHLYKENELKEAEEAKTLCLLSVPGALGAADLLAFAAACQEDISHVRVLRDGSPDHYMALLTFRTCQSAREFHSAFSGVPYSSLEPQALCHMAWVSRVEWAHHGAAPPSHTELPTCPVCLERMDESVAGVLSVQCAHAFHAECLVRWRDARCPVCRCAQTPEPRERAVCAECESEKVSVHRSKMAKFKGYDNNIEGEEEIEEENKHMTEGKAEGEVGAWLEGAGAAEGLDCGSLWICLICGHVGCGRYERGHAAKHFLASNHTYALQLGSNRVWDYAGDNFVHRLVQNKADGKLVAAEGAPHDDKLDAAQLEFTYILTRQLDGQRAYYEERIAELERLRVAECSAAEGRAAAAEEEAATLRAQLVTLRREHTALDRRLQQLTSKVSTLQGALAEERGLAAALAQSHAQWQERAAQRENAFAAEVADLKEQLRDVMFFVEARGQLEKTESATQEEIASASVTVQPPAKPRRRRR